MSYVFMINHLIKHYFPFTVLIISLFSGCENLSQETTLSGRTMGTTYSIILISDSLVETQRIQNGIDSVLVEINRQMSTYIPESEISHFNRWESIEPFPVSKEFAFVVERALDIHKITGGAFDITVMPIVDLWGFFGMRMKNWTPPTDQQITNILERIGSDQLEVHQNQLIKRNPTLQIDVNAIAKGFGVDVVYDYIVNLGYKNCLVEIGGEVRCGGRNKNGEIWKIGIDIPSYNAIPGKQLADIIELEDQAMATSGDYRNFIEWEGEIFSHAIDPRTGYPVKMNVGSATVFAPTCLEADAIATALMVLGEEEGNKLIRSLPEVSCLLILREDTEKYNIIKVN